MQSKPPTAISGACPRVVKRLLTALTTNSKAEVRRKAALILGKSKIFDEQIIKGLITALSDKEDEVVKVSEASIKALGKNAIHAIPHLREKIMAEDLWVQVEAQWAIFEIEEPA
ncbi:MAG: HEAT repeat domain-containing protein [Candidatus Melainabacteria bacterium]|nr:HEAT repeat domain-containing protein [Candidatus Melainabacteria bacterium]